MVEAGAYDASNFNQLLSYLGSMTPQQRAQVGQMHQNDFEVITALSLINSAEARAKQARATQQAMGQPAAPPVNQQVIAETAQSALPEEVGIGALPERSLTGMADGGIVGYADGGGMMGDGYNMAVGYEPNRTPAMSYAGGGYVERYAEGGTGNTPEERRRRLEQDVLSLERELSRLPKSSMSADQKANAAQILTSELNRARAELNMLGGATPKAASSVTDRIPLPAAQAATTEKKGTAPAAAGQPPTDMNQPWHKRLTEAMKSGEAQRQAMLGIADLPYAAVGSVADIGAMALRPFGYKVEAPIMGSKWLKQKAEELGIREREAEDPVLRAVRGGAETLATLGTPLRAPTPARMSEADRLARIKQADEAAAATAAQTEALRLAGPMQPRLAAPGATAESQKAGLAALEADRAAQAARTQAAMKADIEAAQAAKAEAAASKILPEAAPGMGKAEAVVRGAETARLGEEALGQFPQTAAEPDTSYDRLEKNRLVKQGLAALDATNVPKQDIIDAAKKTEPENKGKGWDAEDWLMLGLGLMANKSPYFMQALGEAGMGVIKGKKEARKEEREDVYRRALAREATAKAAALESGSSDIAKATAYADKAYDNWLSGIKTNQMLAMTLTQEQLDAKRQQLLQDAFKLFKIQLPAGMAAANAGAYKFLGVMPS